MKSLLLVKSVELVDGFLPPYHRDYGSSVSKAKCLKVKGFIYGIGNVQFFTPSVILSTSYFPNMEVKHLYENKWMTLNQSELMMTNKTKDLPAYGYREYNLCSNFKNGDKIEIQFSIKSVFNNTTILNRVRLLNIISNCNHVSALEYNSIPVYCPECDCNL